MTHQHDKHTGWIGVDFDGTLATYGTWAGASHVGEPIAPMVERVKRWLAEGREVRVFTARMFPQTVPVNDENVAAVVGALQHLGGRWGEAGVAIDAIRAWCRQHIGQTLTITCVKDYGMVELWDDRAVQVRANTGEMLGHSTRGLA